MPMDTPCHSRRRVMQLLQARSHPCKRLGAQAGSNRTASEQGRKLGAHSFCDGPCKVSSVGTGSFGQRASSHPASSSGGIDTAPPFRALLQHGEAARQPPRARARPGLLIRRKAFWGKREGATNGGRPWPFHGGRRAGQRDRCGSTSRGPPTGAASTIPHASHPGASNLRPGPGTTCRDGPSDPPDPTRRRDMPRSIGRAPPPALPRRKPAPTPGTAGRRIAAHGGGGGGGGPGRTTGCASARHGVRWPRKGARPGPVRMPESLPLV